jgi:HEAT repeat protein/energy-coupling factor transporter ATP-binding protein EcfA2
MTLPFLQYVAALENYASDVRIPGLYLASSPLLLESIFVEPTMVEQMSHVWPKEGQRNVGDPLAESSSHVFSRHRRLVILGEPGQGKSTLLRHYAATMARTYSSGERIPLLVELGRNRAIIKGEQSDFGWLRERLADVPKQALGNKGWISLCEEIRAGRVSLLLDGFDELGVEAQRQLCELMYTMNPANQVVLASRPGAYRGMPFKDFVVYRLEEFNTEKLDRLMPLICQALAEQYRVDDQPVLEKVMNASKVLAPELATKPLFVSFMCLMATWRLSRNELSQFPTSSVPLIRECVEAVIEWHRRYRIGGSWPESFNSLAVVDILAPLALQSFRNASEMIEQGDLDRLGTETKEAFFQHLVPARFIERRALGYVFPLETFREYFAAQAISASPNPYREVRNHLHDKKWQQVIAYTVGCAEKQSPSYVVLAMPTLVRALVRFADPLLQIGLSLLGLSAGGKVAKEAAQGILKVGAQSIQGPMQRWLARSQKSQEFFLLSIWNHCHSIRLSKTEWVLGRDMRLLAHCVANTESIPQKLSHHLTNALIYKYRKFHVAEFGVALVKASMCTSIREFLLQLTHDKDEHVRWIAVDMLSFTISEQVVRDKFLQLTQGHDISLRLKAIMALHAVASIPNVTERLLCVTLDANNSIRGKAAWALRNIASKPEVRERLLQMTQDSDESVRKAAVESLGGAVLEKDVREKLLQMTQDSDESVRKAAVESLGGAVLEKDVREKLLQMTQDSDESVRKATVKSLAAMIGEQEVLEKLICAVKDRDWFVREAAASGLQSALSNPEVRNQLVELALNSSREISISIIEILRDVAFEPEVRRALLRLMQSADKGKRGAAAIAAGRLSIELEMRKRLLDLTNDKTSWVRGCAASALRGVAKDPEVRARLLELTHDKSFVLGYQTDTLGFDRDCAIEALEAATSDPEVRRRILHIALGADSSFSVQIQAATVISRMREGALIPRASRRSLLRWARRWALKSAGRDCMFWDLLEAINQT